MGRHSRRGRGGARSARSGNQAAAKVTYLPHWAIVTFASQGSEKGFFLDSVVTGDEEAAEIEVAAATQARLDAEGEIQYCATFYAPVTAGLRGLVQKARRGQPAPKLNVWLLRRSVGNNREYEVKFVKTNVSEKAPEHAEGWQCTLLEKEWVRPACSRKSLAASIPTAR